MSEPAGVESTLTNPPGDGQAAVTREQLEALTVAELDDQYNPPTGNKAAKVDAILANDGKAFPKDSDGTVLLVVNPLTSDAHHWDVDEPPITAAGTAVPADKADEIIAQAAAGGVQIYRKES